MKFSNLERLPHQGDESMKEKPGSDQGLSFRRLATMDGAKKKAPTEAVPKQLQKSGSTDRQSDEARRSLYRQATQYLSGVMSAVREDHSFPLEPGYAILERIVDIRSPMDALFLKAIHSDDSYDFVVNHSVNVAIYAIKMAETLGYARERLIEMGMVGLFHDIGMAKIPEEIIYKKEKLNDREFHLIKERPKLGYEILRQFGESYAYLAECTLQIYERVDGSGYPRGLKEDEIHEYAQIIGLVDMYEALIHTRPQREKILHY
ncbi:MAG: HD domain-containing phosphohydrolase, partial [Pseudomonadota bacterium]